MKPRKTAELVHTLENKGFKRDNTHHIYYELYVEGKRTRVKTFISHGKKEYDKNLMSELKRQLHFPTKDQAELFFDCPMKFEEYVDLLKAQKIITL